MGTYLKGLSSGEDKATLVLSHLQGAPLTKGVEASVDKSTIPNGSIAG